MVKRFGMVGGIGPHDRSGDALWDLDDMIWWCAVHKQVGDEHGCRGDNSGCSLPMAEVLLIIKESGKWPQWAIARMYAVPDPQPNFPAALLDALAAAAITEGRT